MIRSLIAEKIHLQRPVALEDQLFVRIIRGLPCRQYARASRLVPAAFGLSRYQISRRFIRQSAKKLIALLERRLESYTFTALVLDGKMVLPKTQQEPMRQKLQQAYEQPSYEQAQGALLEIEPNLRRIKGYRHLPQL